MSGHDIPGGAAAGTARKQDSSAGSSPAVVSREPIRLVVSAILTALAVILCAWITRPFLPALAWALAIAVVTHPVHRAIAIRIKAPNLAAAIAVALVTVVIVAPTIFVTQSLVTQGTATFEEYKKNPDGLGLNGLMEENPRIGATIQWIQARVNLRGQLEQLAGTAAGYASALVTGGASAVVQLLVTLFFLFFFFRDRRDAIDRLRALVPLTRGEADALFERVSKTIQATIYGSVVVAFVQGALGGLMFWILGLPAPLLWGTVMGFLALIPVLGTFVIWFPTSLMLFLEGSWIRGLVLAAWGSSAIGLVDNLLYPTLVGKDLKLHTIPVFISVVGGIAFFGMSGLILGPVTMAVTLGLIEIWRRRTVEAPR